MCGLLKQAYAFCHSSRLLYQFWLLQHFWFIYETPGCYATVVCSSMHHYVFSATVLDSCSCSGSCNNSGVLQQFRLLQQFWLSCEQSRFCAKQTLVTVLGSDNNLRCLTQSYVSATVLGSVQCDSPWFSVKYWVLYTIFAKVLGSCDRLEFLYQC
jgi:hypothetical protein